jgi:hypothetical protein
VYTLTDRRVVMRIGIVLTLTFNLPLKRIAAAGLHLRRAAPATSADAGRQRPHRLAAAVAARAPLALARPQPMLRCVPKGAGGAAARAGLVAGHRPGRAADRRRSAHRCRNGPTG